MYVPNTPAEQREMLERLGARSIDELFECIAEEYRLAGPLNLPPGQSEMELSGRLQELAARNRSADRAVCFLGGGCYDHFVPAVVDVIASRSEYYTAYTPYQAEASQGTLQTGFEFQTLMCQLTGMEVANASLYEGATAMVEAAFMAMSVTGRSGKIVISGAVHPEYRKTLETYLTNLETRLVVVPFEEEGVTPAEAIAKAVDSSTACVILQSPNFFGAVEPVARAAGVAHDAGALFVQVFDPISLGVLRPPADCDADVAVAEGQPLGTPMSFGGPFLGIFACREKYMRKMPGRIVGETVDRRGRRAYVLTLQTREQHIRREKATSNICTNQGLLALRASVYLSLLGPRGLKETAELCCQKAHYAAERLSEAPGLSLRHSAPFFKEFVLQTPGPAERFAGLMLDAGFHAGVPLGQWFPDMRNCLLVAVTERRTKAEIDALADAWKKLVA